VRWNFQVAINGLITDVADYYLPIEKAEYIWSYSPLALTPEQFGSASQILQSQKSAIRFSDMRASDGTNWFSIADWILGYCIDDGAGNLDQHYGWRSDGVSLTDSVGHADDPTASTRTIGTHMSVLVGQGPVMAIAMSHTGNFVLGQTGTYTVIVSNGVLAGPTSGTSTVTETMPSGMTLASMAGTGWTCLIGGSACTRSDVLQERVIRRSL